ncbi:DUF1328 domain-containing protein [Panacibacter ginsenosidivorans]
MRYKVIPIVKLSNIGDYCVEHFLAHFLKKIEIYYSSLKHKSMLRWTIIFLIVAIVAGIFGFAGIAASAAGIAKVLFFIFIVLFLLSLILGRKSIE